MLKYFVLLSDDRSAGRGVRGDTLLRFLRLFHGTRAVRGASPAELNRRRPQTTQTLFVGLPTSLTADQLAGVRASRIVLFDYHDHPGPYWQRSDQEFLSSLSADYWKPILEADELGQWKVGGFQGGCLPIRRPQELAWQLRYLRLCQSVFRTPSARRRRFDAGFLGKPTALRRLGVADLYFQRVEWLIEIIRQHPELRFWGGLAMDSQNCHSVERRYGNASDITFASRRISFSHYFRRMSECCVSLAPAGNARWTYRHYELVYVGNVLVSTDLSRSRLLVPLPESSLVHVPDHAPVLPYIHQALDLDQQGAERASVAVKELEQFFDLGVYSRRRPRVMDSFEAQFGKKIDTT